MTASAAQLIHRRLRDDNTDRAWIHRLHSDPSTNEHNPSGAVPDLESAAALHRSWVEHWDGAGFGYELAELDGEVVGIGGVRGDRWADEEVLNLYWRLLPEHWGRGLAAPLAARALELGREVAAGRPIRARMLPGNVRSARVAERLGLRRRADLDGCLDGADWIVYSDA